MSYFQPDNLPYNTAPYYWIAVKGAAAATMELAEHGFTQQEEGIFLTRVPCPWYDAWKMLEEMIDTLPREETREEQLQIAVVPETAQPHAAALEHHFKPVSDIRDIAGSLWLGDALLADRVVCYLQPIQDRRGKVFGYESFARVEFDGESVIAGGPIFAAGRALKLEYRLDRYLHQKAVEAFVASEMDNRLFINFQSGFIHRPEIYLDGLSHVVKKYDLPERNIVLEFTQSQSSSQHNVQHLKAICHYCRQQGYSLSLDDITTFEALETLLEIVEPDFVKLDMYLTQEAQKQRAYALILQLVEKAHANGVTVIAEGVESQEIYDILLKADVDLFQGFLIGKPAPSVGAPTARTVTN